MKKFILTIACLLMSALPLTAGQQSASAGNIDWSLKQTWSLQTEPLDFVQSLDNKKVFVLGADSKVYIFTPEGTEIGAIPVDKGTTAIDIAPRGETLYVINKKGKTYTAIDVSVTRKIDISGSPFLGNENAPVAMVIFSDFQ